MTININFNITHSNTPNGGFVMRAISNFRSATGSSVRLLHGRGYPTGSKPLIDQLYEEIRKSRLTCSKSTTTNRTTAVNALRRFFDEKLEGGRGITVAELTPDHIKAFERWHRDKGLTLNYSACNMRNLRALINRIASSDREEWCRRLFADVRTKKSAPMYQKAAERDFIRKLMGLELAEGSIEYRARDLSLFCLLTQGMPFVDLAHLKKNQYRDGRIIYNRHKTNCTASPLLLPAAREILERNMAADSSYLFPVLTSENPDEMEAQYSRALQRYNYALGKLARMAAPGCRFTSYTPRHTWASTAHELGVNDNVISQALAHKSTATTQAYMKSICYDIVDKASMEVWDYLSRP